MFYLFYFGGDPVQLLRKYHGALCGGLRLALLSQDAGVDPKVPNDWMV